jgi:hypothetical protein
MFEPDEYNENKITSDIPRKNRIYAVLANVPCTLVRQSSISPKRQTIEGHIRPNNNQAMLLKFVDSQHVNGTYVFKELEYDKEKNMLTETKRDKQTDAEIHIDANVFKSAAIDNDIADATLLLAEFASTRNINNEIKAINTRTDVLTYIISFIITTLLMIIAGVDAAIKNVNPIFEMTWVEGLCLSTIISIILLTGLRFKYLPGFYSIRKRCERKIEDTRRTREINFYNAIEINRERKMINAAYEFIRN